MKKRYHTIDKRGEANEAKLAASLSKNGQLLLPMVDLIEHCRLARDELIGVADRPTVQAVLELSAEQAAGGPCQQGKPRAGEVVWRGHQAGTAILSDREMEVKRPRPCRKGPRGTEVEVPAYEAMQDEPRPGGCLLNTLIRGVPTRQYRGAVS